MTAQLSITNAGAAAIADGANVGTKSITFTRLALGSGTASGSQAGRTSLITQRDIRPVTGDGGSAGRIAFRGDYNNPSANYPVTEVGLFARIGAGGAEFLCAYWVAAGAGDAIAAASTNAPLVVPGIIEIVTSAAALTITPALNVSVGVPADVVRTSDLATESAAGIVELATDAEVSALTARDRAVSPGALASVLSGYSNTATLQTWVNGQLNTLRGGVSSSLDTLAEIATALGQRLNKSGGTMTGALNLVTPADGDDSKKAVNSEWVRDLLNREGGMDRQMFSSANGMQVTTSDTSGTLVTLASSMAGHHLIKIFGRDRQSSGLDHALEYQWMPIGMLGTTYGDRLIITAGGGDTYGLSVWRASNTALRIVANSPQGDTIFAIVARRLAT